MKAYRIISRSDQRVYVFLSGQRVCCCIKQWYIGVPLTSQGWLSTGQHSCRASSVLSGNLGGGATPYIHRCGLLWSPVISRGPQGALYDFQLPPATSHRGFSSGIWCGLLWWMVTSSRRYSHYRYSIAALVKQLTQILPGISSTLAILSLSALLYWISNTYRLQVKDSVQVVGLWKPMKANNDWFIGLTWDCPSGELQLPWWVDSLRQVDKRINCRVFCLRWPAVVTVKLVMWWCGLEVDVEERGWILNGSPPWPQRRMIYTNHGKMHSCFDFLKTKVKLVWVHSGSYSTFLATVTASFQWVLAVWLPGQLWHWQSSGTIGCSFSGSVDLTLEYLQCLFCEIVFGVSYVVRNM